MANDLPDPIWRRELLDHRELIDRLARRLLEDRHLAEDVAQETWRIALEQPPRHPRSLPAWLGRVVRTAASRLRREGRRREHRERQAARSEATPSAHDVVVERERHRVLVGALLGLSEPLRTVLLLRHVEDLPPRRIATRLGISVEAVKARLKRGAAELRRELDATSGRDRGSWQGVLAVLLDGASEAPSAARPARWVAILAGAGLFVIVVGLGSWGLADGGAVPLPRTAAAQDVPADSRRTRVASTSPMEPAGRTTALASVPATSGEDTSSVLLTVRWTEGGPVAPGLGVRAVATGAAQPLLETRRGVTDAEGRLRFDDVPPGRLVLTADRGGRVVVDVGAGRSLHADLAVPAGVDVEGLVTDPSGAPLPGASVWLSEPSDHSEGSFRAETDAEGRFRFASVAPHCWIGARARGFAPTRLRALGGKPGESREVRLRMPGPGGSLRGIVLGPSGMPVGNAVVLIGVPAAASIETRDGIPTLRPPGYPVATDAGGAFRADGLPPGPQTVLIRSRAFAPFEGSVTVVPDLCADITATLTPGANLTGVVRQDGRPLAGARMGLHRDLSFYALTWSRETFLSSFTYSGEDGSFRLTGLAAGSVRAWAKTAHGDGIEQDLVLVVGQTMQWDPWLGAPAIVGRVLDEEGRGLAGWYVEARKGYEPCDRDLPTTDADGRFLVSHPPREVDRIQVREPESLRVCATADLSTAAIREVVIRVARRDRPSSFLTGVVCDESGRAVRLARVRAQRSGETDEQGFEVDLATRAFRVGPLPPGSYELLVEAPGFAGCRLPPQQLVPEETRDVGTVVLHRE